MHRFGDYEVLARLAASGPAAVYLVRKRGAGRFMRVACLKTFRLPSADEDVFFVETVREAAFAKLLRHDGCVQMHDVDFEDGVGYVVMELVVGETLHDLLRRARAANAPVPFAITAGIAMRVADALHYAHSATDRSGAPLNVVHRDLQPSNVMLSYEGAVKVLDFGVGRIENHISTITGTSSRNAAYLAPEQLQGRTVDPRTDIYALGLMMHEAFSNEARYEGVSFQEIALQTFRSPPPVAAVVPELPPALVQITDRALAAEMSHRYDTAAEVADDLRAYLAAASQRDDTDERSRYLREVYGHHASRKVQAIQAVIAGEEDVDALLAVFGAERPSRLDFPGGSLDADAIATTKAPAPAVDDEFEDETVMSSTAPGALLQNVEVRAAPTIALATNPVVASPTTPTPTKARRSSTIGLVGAVVVGIVVGVFVSLLLAGRFG